MEAAGVKTTVVLPADLWERAKMHAVRERTDLRLVVIAALEAYLPKNADGKRGAR
jgi:hypothetical protein